MMKILAATVKELLLLRRDRTGLLILFMVPALLVIVITLVQENVMELTGQKKTEVLFLDLDEGSLGKILQQQLSIGNIEPIVLDNQKHTAEDVLEYVTDGEYQAGIVLHQKSSETFQKNVQHLFQETNHNLNQEEKRTVPLLLYFDPGAMPGFRAGLKAQLLMTLGSIEMESKIDVLGKSFKTFMDSYDIPQGISPLEPELLSELMAKPILSLEENSSANSSKTTPPYNPVQQNVPAWAIFGMFFTAIPIAGSIMQERKSGIWIRLTSMPVSHLQLFTGKVVAYVGVCFCQFLLIGLIGVLLFPRIGLPQFIVAQNQIPVILSIFSISLAVCGLGIFLGMACNSLEQATMSGASFVVTAAAIGGVMVPVYAMPELMQRVSIISPLNWGLTAFQDLLIRGYSILAVLDDLAKLCLFFLLSVILSWKLSQSRI